MNNMRIDEWLRPDVHESAEYKAGKAAAELEIDSGGNEQTDCPYIYTPYENTPYRRWMAGYWDVMDPALGDGG